MSVLDRAALDESPLADLHTIASELSIDGYRRLRRAALIDAIIEKQGGEPAGPSSDTESPAAEESPEPAPKRTRTRRSRSAAATAEHEDGDKAEASAETVAAEASTEAVADDTSGDEDASDEDQAPRRRRGRRGGRTRARGRDEGQESEVRDEPAEEESSPDDEEQTVEGVVELLPNGSGFLRVSPPEPSDDDVYISAAQVKRCELVAGDRISGPRRAPRRSERFPSMIRIDTINDRPASEIAEGTRFDDLPAAFPSERIRLGSEDPTIKAIEWLTPFGKGSRVSIVGGPRAGKTEALARLATALSGIDELQLSVALAGVRPEEVFEWSRGPLEPAAHASFAASADAQAGAVERVIDQARRIAARGADAVVLVDTLDGLHPSAARKALAAARNIIDGGSVTVIATGSKPIGGETTVITLDAGLASTGRFPALDLAASGTIRPELLVGEAGAEAIARARAEALDG
ncbi:MAG TPA: Rho termination factor N-terminal domain-containing protein [Solirubrobacteraceae bacterium]|nr:Rho termination factor N-terminal domain-containing protein [Solirubrobacteraceae bacterium]